jgi:PAS domain S-box-containing protein
MSFIEITHPEDREKDLEKLRRLVRGEVPEYSNEKRYLRKDGRVVWVQVHISLVRDGQGWPLHTVAVVQDITERKRVEAALRESEERSRAILRAIPDLMFLLSADGVYLDYHAKNPDDLLVPPEAFLGKNIRDIFPPELAEGFRLSFERALDSKEPQTHEYKLMINGEARQYEARIVATADDRLLSVVRDITERRRLEDDLRSRERVFSALVENSPDVIARVDRALRFLYVSPAVERVLGVRAQQFIGKTLREVQPISYDWEGFEASCRLSLENQITVVREYSRQGRHHHTRIIPEFFHGGSVHSLMCIIEDITGRKRAEEELHRLSARLLDLQDEERRRISRQLHDVTAQNLFAISINLARLQELDPLPPHEFTETLAECQNLCEQSLQEVRTLSYLLHPPMLDQAGLVSALRWYIDGFTKRSGIDVGLVVTQEIGRLPREMETDLFRIVQEGLANILRHSGSSTATVRLEKQAAQLTLQIKDQGRGMPKRAVTAVPNRVESLGVGIAGMRQRLRQLGGRLKIDSVGQGTTVTATVPLPAKGAFRRAAGLGVDK